MEGAPEHLVLIDPADDDPLDGWPGQVRHRISPRVSVVTADDAALASLRGHRAVIGVFVHPVPPHLIDGLDDEERLSVEAWSVRHEPKRRRGDGVDWGAAGFDPPDP